LRSSQLVAPDRLRFALNAQPLSRADGEGLERTREVDADSVRDKIANHQAVPTPEETFEQLWQELRLALDGG
jgi:hypothetical protein